MNKEIKWSLKPLKRVIDQTTRLHQCPIPIVAITGGFGSGKSTVSKWFKDQGFLTISADELVKLSYQTPKVLAYVMANSPHVLKSQNVINFPELRKWAFENPERLSALEKIIYQELPAIFLNQAQQSQNQNDVIIYEIPLLFEKGLESKVDLIITIIAPEQTQIDRAQKRDGSTTEVLRKILAEQGDLKDKARRSDVIIDNSGTVSELDGQLTGILNQYFELKKH